MRQFQRLVMLLLVVAALAALLVTPAFAADATLLQPEPTPVTAITDINGSETQLTGIEMPSYTAIKVEVQIPGDVYIGCSRFSSTDTLACMQRFCSGQSAGDAVLENGVYRCVKQFTPQSAPKRN